MNRAYFSPSAQRDLQEILEFIAIDIPGAASRHGERIESACRDLALNPEIGAPRFDLLPKLRVWSVGKYAIFYRQTDDGIEVVRVVQGARDFGELFK